MGATEEFVVVTGFGPFGIHNVNASWVAVQELAKIGLGDNRFKLIIQEMPVVYETVHQNVTELWKKYNPVLMVHVGVSGIASLLELEQISFNKGYTRLDVSGSCPSTETCVSDCCEDTLRSCINMSLVSEEVNNAGIKVKAAVSHDPGKYLCAYSYFLSLHKKKECSAFIHVPELDHPYTSEELGEGLKHSINSMLKQVRQ